jgi:hypothetical protein
MNFYQVLAIIFGVLALIFGAIGQFVAGTKDKDELKEEIKSSKVADKYLPPNIEFEFSQPDNLAYTVKNISDKTIAENVLISFGIADLTAFDLNKLPHQPVPLKSIELNYVNPKMASGPFKVLGNFAVPGHRYFGIMYLNCKGCSELKTYWVYIEVNKNGKSFYAKRDKDDTYNIDIAKLANKDEKYFESLVRLDRRIYIK